jgi:hypothetical protein
MKERPKPKKIYTQIPYQVRQLKEGTQAAFRELVEMIAWRGFTDQSDEQCAAAAGMTVATWKDRLATLRTTVVDGCQHPFVEVVWVKGRRRLYPVNHLGQSTVPAEHRDKIKRPRPTSKSVEAVVPGTFRTKKEPARRFRLESETPENDGGKREAERQRPAQPEAAEGPLDTPMHHAKVCQLQLPGPHPAAAEPQAAAIAAAVVKPQAQAEPAAAEPQAHAAPSSDELLTDEQLKFYAKLTPEQQAMFKTLPAAKRAQTLAPHAAFFDPIIFGDQVQRLFPRRTEAPPITPPQSTAECIAQVHDDPALIQLGAEMLSRDFHDRKFFRGYMLVMTCRWNGSITREAVEHAYRHAMRPGRRNPGAYFWKALQDQTGLKADDFRRLTEPGRTADGRRFQR